jgi:hypothetical protein
VGRVDGRSGDKGFQSERGPAVGFSDSDWRTGYAPGLASAQRLRLEPVLSLSGLGAPHNDWSSFDGSLYEHIRLNA